MTEIFVTLATTSSSTPQTATSSFPPSPIYRPSSSLPSMPANARISLTAPPPYLESASILPRWSSLPTHAVSHNRPRSSSLAEPLPDYTKFAEKMRAERCFWYGFVLRVFLLYQDQMVNLKLIPPSIGSVPIWFWGFLHYWNIFSQIVPGSQAADKAFTALPDWHHSAGEAIPTLHLSHQAGSNRTAISFSRHSTLQPATSLPLAMNRPDLQSVWRKEEKEWAMKCAYAIACWWTLVIIVVVIAVQLGAVDYAFPS